MSDSKRSERNDSLSWSIRMEIERICDRFESAHRRGELPRLEDYVVSDWPDGQNRALLRDLLVVEIDHRHQLGQQPKIEEYLTRFPRFKSAVRDAFEACEGGTRDLDLGPQTGFTSRKIGPYKLLQKIGEGGMGTVWMADQQEPVRRRVALKLVKDGFKSKEVLVRFEAERQALAMMDHQNIARVLDAGVTEDGRPFFAMELVQGVPFTEYCDKHRLTPDERLELFVPVCSAIQHAHQKGIIHRDIKPSNVLVTLYDGKPVPKVIDFGLAKALQHQTKLTDRTIFTEFGKVLGTLNYMSPEQAEMDSLDIDTRTDIYSLGVMLYELLTGSTPLEKETAQRQALLQVLKAIRENEPPTPSKRLSDSRDKIDGISKQRRIEPARLQRILQGDLDWIVMKALEKDRTRRYATANDFADDVKRYISGDIVEARPPSPTYRLRKLIQKNRVFFAAVAGIVAVLVAGISAVTWHSIRLNRALEAEQSAKQELADQVRVARAAEQKSRKAEAEANIQKQQAQLSRRKAEATLARSNLYLSQDRWSQNRAAEAISVLRSIPEEHRNFEWYRARRQFLGSDMTLACRGPVLRVAFGGDGDEIWAAELAGRLRRWDARTGAEIIQEAKPSLNMKHQRSPNALNLWDANNYSIRGFSPSRDGRRVVTGDIGGQLTIWDAQTGETIQPAHFSPPPLTQYWGQPESMRCVAAFSPDGSLLVTGGHSLKLWNTSTGEEAQRFKGIPRTVTVNFGPNGEEERVVSGQTNVTCVGFSPDGKYVVSGGNDSRLVLWDVRTGQETKALSGHGASVSAVSFSPDGRQIVSGSLDNTAKVWEVQSGEELHTLRGHGEEVHCVAFSSDGSRILSGSTDKTLKLWNAQNGLEIRSFVGHTGWVSSVAFSDDGGRIVSGSWDGTVKVWDAKTGEEVPTLRGHRDLVTSVAVSPDGRRIVSGGNGFGSAMLVVWDARTGREVKSWIPHTNRVSEIAFSLDGRHFVSASWERVLLWDAHTLEVIRRFGGLRRVNGAMMSLGQCVSFSPDGTRIVSGGDNNTLWLWDVGTGEELLQFVGNSGVSESGSDRVNSVSFSPDGRRIVSGGDDQKLRLWDAQTGRELRTLIGHKSVVSSVLFSPDGTVIVSGSADDTLILWDAETGDDLQTLTGHKDDVFSVEFSPDGTRIVSGSADRTLKLWDAHTGEELLTLTGHENKVTSVAFSRDGRRIISGSTDRTLKLWDTPSGDYTRIRSGMDEHDYRVLKSRLDLHWHSAQAAAAEATDDLLLAVIHRAWAFVAGPHRAVGHKQFHDTFRDFSDWNRKQDQPVNLRYYPIVEQALKLPRGSEMSLSDALDTNEQTWKAVVTKTGTKMDDEDVHLMRLACDKLPRFANLNTLALAEYRAGHYPEAVEVANRSIAAARQQEIIDAAATGHPSDLATLAMSYLQQGKIPEAQAYREQLNEAMELKRWNGSLENRAFLAEVNALFASGGTPAHVGAESALDNNVD